MCLRSIGEVMVKDILYDSTVKKFFWEFQFDEGEGNNLLRKQIKGYHLRSLS